MKNKKVFVILGFIVFLIVIIVGLVIFFKSKEKYRVQFSYNSKLKMKNFL